MTLPRVNIRHIIFDLFVILSAFALAIYLRLDSYFFFENVGVVSTTLLLVSTTKVICLWVSGVYSILWRYVSVSDALKIAKASMLSTILVLASITILNIDRLPRSVYFIDLILSTFLLCSSRILRRVAFERRPQMAVAKSGVRTLIFGAGRNGKSLAQRFFTDALPGFHVLGFVDDDPGKVGRFMYGIKVLGTRKNLPSLIKDYSVKEVLVAVSSPSGELLRDIFEICRPFGIKPRLMSHVSSVSGDKARLSLIRDIELADLLSRPARNILSEETAGQFQDKTILITGAGGSIGSEISRQIMGMGPRKLILVDHSEFNLYQVDQELKSVDSSNVTISVLLDLKDKHFVDDTIRRYKPDIVFHAAAYKHVHLVEASPYSAIVNNIGATENLLRACLKENVKSFVLISTDKAVNPIGIMGATKRVCEMMVAQLAGIGSFNYCAVRFGNVLGSSGSLIPLLQRQIKNGEPITITHPEMARYFMLIPEAVSLVLTASTLSRPGDILILKMGEPVKIVDISNSLMTLMGRTSNQCPIIFTGIRPGEKLVEELYLCGNELDTQHPDILVAPRGDAVLGWSKSEFWKNLEELTDLAKRSDPRSLELLFRFVNSRKTIESNSDFETLSI